MDGADLPCRAASRVAVGPLRALPIIPQPGASREDGGDAPIPLGRAVHPGYWRWRARGRISGLRLRLPRSERADRAARRSPADHESTVDTGARELRGQALPGTRSLVRAEARDAAHHYGRGVQAEDATPGGQACRLV